MRRPLVAALVVLVAAVGAGFWALSRNQEPIGSAAQAAPNDAEADTADGEDDPDPDPTRPVGPFVELDIVDITGDVSPHGGQVVFDDGSYYVLSTPPEPANPDEITSEEFSRLFRAKTFYTRTEDGRWEANEVEDRLISSFDVDDGVIYALSNGTVPEAGRPGGEIAALGTSPDRGRTWEWQELPEVPPGTSIAMFRADGSTIVATGRPGRPEQYEAIQVARDAWLDIDEDLPLWEVDESSISYIDDAKIDAGDPCAVLHERLDYFSLVAAGQRLRTGAQELDAVVAALNREAEGFDLDLAAAGCIIDRDTIESFPQVITVTWDELGVEIPESWTSSFDLFRDQGGSLIRLDSPLDGKPLDRFHTEDGRLEVVTLEAATGPGHRSLWTTSDGVTWDRETMTESELSIQGDVEPPVAGNSTFRVDWSGQRADSGVPQRSVAGGPWEDLDLDELAPGLDFSDHVFVVRGTDYGVFLLARFETASLIVLYSSNGIDWGTFETTGNELELHQIGDTIVAFDQYPVVTELGEGINARVLLLRPQS